MKKTAAILLALVFILYIGGVKILYGLKLDTVKETSFNYIKKGNLNKEETRDFTFTKLQYAELNWADFNKEFTYNNQDYDILSVHTIGNQVKMLCYKDDLETEISTAFNTVLDKLFTPHQQSKNADENMSGKIFKEYLPQEYIPASTLQTSFLTYIFQEHKFISFSPVDSIWHPPSLC